MTDKVFEYNGSRITFLLEKEDVMINATQMAKPFGKRPIDWLRLPSSQDFITSLCDVRKLHFTQLIETIKGNFRNNRKQGTWMHKDVAIEFARWLSPMFAIWCNDRILELFKYGFTATDSTLDTLIANPELGVKLFAALKEERERHAAEMDNEIGFSRELMNLNINQAEYVRELREQLMLQKLVSKRYFYTAVEQQHILKENGIRIPANLKIKRAVYLKELERLSL